MARLVMDPAERALAEATCDALRLSESAKTAMLSRTHAPIGKGGTNWITKAKPGNTGQLPAYIQNVRNAIMRDGKSESDATQIAIGRVRDWAEGKGNVGPEVKAAAAKAMAEYDAMRAKSKAKKGGKMQETPTGALATELSDDQIGNLSLLEAPFDEHAHPRSRTGQWITKLGGMKPGSKTHIDGITVERNKRGDFTVHHPPSSPRGRNPDVPNADANLASPEVAADSLAGAVPHAPAHNRAGRPRTLKEQQRFNSANRRAQEVAASRHLRIQRENGRKGEMPIATKDPEAWDAYIGAAPSFAAAQDRMHEAQQAGVDFKAMMKVKRR